MKKVYSKPLIYCENQQTGIVVSNSKEYKQKMKTLLEKLRNAGLIESGHHGLQDGSRK